MRKIVMFEHVSADGYFATSDATLDWVVSDDEVGKSAMASTHADTVMFGRKTYEMFAAFWPKALDDPKTAPDPHRPGARSATMHDMAVFLNKARKLVFSKSLKEATWTNSQLIRDFDPKAIEAMKREDGGGILIFGSGQIVSQLTRHGLIDEYQFVVSPVVLGAGRKLIEGVPRRSVTLAEARSFPSGVAMLRYTA